MTRTPSSNRFTARLFSRLRWQITRSDPLTVRPLWSFLDHWTWAWGAGGCFQSILAPPSRRASSAIALDLLVVVEDGGLVGLVLGQRLGGSRQALTQLLGDVRFGCFGHRRPPLIVSNVPMSVVLRGVDRQGVSAGRPPLQRGSAAEVWTTNDEACGGRSGRGFPNHGARSATRRRQRGLLDS